MKTNLILNVVILLLFSFATIFVWKLNSHQYSYQITDVKGNQIYCDDFTIEDSSVYIVLSTGDTIQMDSVIDIKPLN